MAFPTTVRRATAVSATSNSTTWTPSFTWGTNTAIADGESVLWVFVVACDGASTLSETGGNGWTLQDNTSQGSVCHGVFRKVTTTAFAASAAPGFVLGSSASEQFSGVLLAFKAGSGATINFFGSTAATSSSTNSDPPNWTNNETFAVDATVVATRAGDSTVVATVAPTNYANLQTIAGGGTNGASTNTAERQINVAGSGSEDPGTFTSAAEQWVAYTFAAYEIVSTPASFPAFRPGADFLHMLVR